MKSKEKGKEVYKYLRQRDVPETAAKAMVANIAVESGYTFDPAVKQEGEREDPAYGLFQFDPRGKGLDKPYKKYLEDTEKEDSMESQLDFVVDSVYGDYKEGRKHIGFGNVKKFKEAADSGDVEAATKAFSEKLLRPGQPHMDRRVNAAKNIEQYIGNAEEEVTIEKTLQAKKGPEGGEAQQAAAQIPLGGAPGQMQPAVFQEGMPVPAAQGQPLDPFRNMPELDPMQGMLRTGRTVSF